MIFKIGRKKISENSKCFIVGEISANHNHSLENARKLIRLAARAGFDAVKLQTYKPDTITLNSNKKDFLIKSKSPWAKKKNLWSLYQKGFTPWDWHYLLFQEAKKNKILIFSSPFDETAVDFLESIKCPLYKIASPEINHIPLIKKIAKTGKPVILSTGLSTFNEVKLALKVLKKNGAKNIILLKCSSAYPAPFEELNLLTINDYKKRFNVISGYSDHTSSELASIVAVSCGAKVIEKHIALEKMNTVDSFFSLKSNMFKNYVNNIRNAEKSLGKVNYNITKSCLVHLQGKRSIYISKKILKGEKFDRNNIKVVRPSYGLNPKYFDKVIGKISLADLDEGSRLTPQHIKNFKK
jgi:pseudaminic acid synthase